jgi:hypothetical protein
MNPNRYQVTEYYNDAINGTHNTIVASAATLKGCLTQYNKHLKAWEIAKLDRKAIVTKFYCDNVQFSIESI